MKAIKILLDIVIAAGVLTLMTGLYFWLIKAGIPFQDATPEMKMQYANNLRTGEILIAIGFLVSVLAPIPRIIVGVVSRRRKQGNCEYV